MDIDIHIIYLYNKNNTKWNKTISENVKAITTYNGGKNLCRWRYLSSLSFPFVVSIYYVYANQLALHFFCVDISRIFFLAVNIELDYNDDFSTIPISTHWPFQESHPYTKDSKNNHLFLACLFSAAAVFFIKMHQNIKPACFVCHAVTYFDRLR